MCCVHELKGKEREMKILKIFEKGFQTTNKRLKMVVYLWLINFIFSVLIVTPVYFLIKKDLSGSLMADQILKGSESVYFSVWGDNRQDCCPG
jgi:hypothetical protein